MEWQIKSKEYTDKSNSTSMLKLLIVEDEDTQFDMIVDSITDFNLEETNIEIVYTRGSTYKDAVSLLLSDEFDAAIVDLLLDKTKTADDGYEGNDIVKYIMANLRFPIFVRSGFVGKLDIEDHNFINVYNKDDNIDDILYKIKDFYLKGFTMILGTKGKIEKYLNKIFWDSLSENINNWDEGILNEEEHEKALVRHCISLLSEHMGLNESLNNFETFHPAEFYIYPPINKNLTFGDLLIKESSGDHYIILSPACDLAQRKTENVLLAVIETLQQNAIFSEQQMIIVANESKGKVKSASNLITKLIKNNYNYKYHFLPNTGEFPGGFINFQKLMSLSLSEIEDDFTKYASVSEKFSKDITSRFSQYYTRQGQPDMDAELLLQKVLSKI